MHGNLMRLDPMMQQYLTVSLYLNIMLLMCMFHMPHGKYYMPEPSEVMFAHASGL